MDEQCASAAPEPEYLLTLVHGTWAPDSPWIDPKWFFLKELQRFFGERRVLTLPFGWSGANSHEARIAAAKSLSQHLLHASVIYPRARHYIIAHSHGGNVALHALRDHNLQSAVEGLVCMSTPFIWCKPRRIDRLTTIRSIVRVIRALLMPFVWGAVLFVLGVLLFSVAMESAQDFALGVAAAIALFGIFATLRAYVRFLLGLLDVEALSVPDFAAQQSRLLRNLAPSPLPSLRCLCVTSVMDEALFGLRALRRFAETPFSTYALVQPLLIIFAFLMTAAFFVTTGWAIILDLANAPVTRIHHAEELASRALAPLLGAAAICALVLLITVAIMPLFSMLRAHRLGFGEYLRDSLLLDIFVQPTPEKVGEIQLAYQPFLRTAKALGRLLRNGVPMIHSATYADTDTIEQIAKWMIGNARSVGTHDVAPARQD